MIKYLYYYNKWFVWCHTVRNFERVWSYSYGHALGCVEEKVSILYKQNPFEVNIGQYNTFILKYLKSSMNLWTVNEQFVTGVYAMLTYLTSYFCKLEHTMNKLMKKTSKEAYGKDIQSKMISIGNIFFLLNARFLHMKESKKYYYYGWGIQLKMLCMFLMI